MDQLQALSRGFAAACAEFGPIRLAVPGCATANGLEHVDPSVTRRAVGVDLNPRYLEIARARHSRLGGVVELVAAPLEVCAFPPESFDLIFAGLIFEYVEPEALLRRIAFWLAPGGACCDRARSASTPIASPAAGTATATGPSRAPARRNAAQSRRGASRSGRGCLG